MVVRLPSLTLMRVVGALLLAIIGIHAGEPMHDLQRERGSAFSVTTPDVAVAPQRRAATESIVVLPAPPAHEPAAIAGIFIAIPELPAPRPDSRGPPETLFVAHPPAPRAPPVS